MHLKDADGIANSVDPDQTAPGSALFAQDCLSASVAGSSLCLQGKEYKDLKEFDVQIENSVLRITDQHQDTSEKRSGFDL